MGQDDNGIFNFIIVIIFLGATIWIGSKIYTNYLHAEKKPFWEDTETVQVCRTPYHSSEDCYVLLAENIDNSSVIIHFKNGGKLITQNLTCYFAAQIAKEPRYTFCRSWDESGHQWDFMPVWINYGKY